MQGVSDESGIDAKDKVIFLKASHKDMSHLGGAHAIHKALKEEVKEWTNLHLDASWIVLRCEECRQNSAQGCVKPEPRHLPKTATAGEVIGFDLKTVTPHNGPRWIMLV